MKSNMIAKGLLSAAVAGLVSGAIAPKAFADTTKKAGGHAECKKDGCTKECNKANGCGKDGCSKDMGHPAAKADTKAADAPAAAMPATPAKK